MVLDPREKEQLQRLKKFWRTYGIQFLIATGIFVVFLTGFNIYSNYQSSSLAEATELYEQFRQLDASHQQMIARNASIADSNLTAGTFSVNDLMLALEEVAELLRLEYTTSNQAGYANIRLAAIYAGQQDFAPAGELLRWVITNTDSPHANNLATLQLSRILLFQGKNEEALALMESYEDVSAVAAELRGDILRAMERYEEAHDFYQQAIDRGGNQPFIRYKISSLPIDP